MRGSGVDEKVIDMPWIDLVPLTDDERELFIAEDLADYAAQIERDEALSRQDAIARAHDELSVSVRDGHATAAERGDRRFTALDGSGVSVGWLWVTPFPDLKGQSRAFLYQITVRPAMRARGFGSAMLSALEGMLAAEGTAELWLNVNDANVPARRLYRRAGYEVAEVLDGKRQMFKTLT